MDTSFVTKVSCPICGEKENKPYRFEKRLISKKEIDLGHNKCKNCGLQYVSPRPDNNALSLLYDNEYHTSTVSGVYNVDSQVSRNEYVTFTKYLSKYVSKNSHVLDVGCGVGNLLLEVKKQSDLKCTGIEISEDAANIAMKNGLDVFVGSLHDAKLDSERYDAVTLLYVLEHVENPLEILLEIKRVLKDGGYLLLAVPNYRYLHLAHESFISQFIKAETGSLHPEEHLQNFTPKTLKKLVEKAGFDLVKHNCAKPLVIGSPYTRIIKNSAYYFVKILSLLGYNIGGIHFILRKK